MANLDNKERLWIEYNHSRTSAIREQLIIEYVPLVKLVAGRLSMYLGSNVEYDDLVSYGVFGLIDAIDKFDYGKGIKFETYASLRIRGAILDQIRKMDWIPRSVRQKQKAIDSAMANVEREKGQNYTDDDIAKELGISSDEYSSWLSQTNVSNISSLDDFMEQGSEPRASAGSFGSRIDPVKNIEDQELKDILVEAIKVLTEKERTVIMLYYYEDMTLKEISQAMNVSESRVSQLHSKSLRKLKAKLGDDFVYFMG
jgi:RNA polymerase sigma factor for flagellar operon FliA